MSRTRRILTADVKERRPAMQDGAPTSSSASTDGSADCLSCLGRDVPTFLHTHDNFGDFGPICYRCIATLQFATRWITRRGQCHSCGDTARVRTVGRIELCTTFCVPILMAFKGRL